jgi:hemerythrin-like domain-containing protein
MPLHTGASASRSEEVPDVLLDCHQRLRQFTALAAELATRPTTPPDEVREVAAKVQRYLTVALPLHEEDEETSLFPRLLVRAPELRPKIASLREDHTAQGDRVRRLLAVCEELQRTPQRVHALREALGRAAEALAETWRVHLAAEEQDIFPSVRTALSAEDRESIRKEMQERRARLPR